MTRLWVLIRKFMGLTGGFCTQGCVWCAGLHDAIVPGGDAVPLLSHHSLRAVPTGLRAPRGVQFGHLFCPARPALAGAAAAPDRADARLHGGPRLCHPPLRHVRHSI